MKVHTVIDFGPFEIDTRSLELRREGTLVPLEPLPTRILARLAADCGSLVTRDELLELGWPDTPWVAEQALNTCIYQIRQALGGSGPAAAELETLRGRGYRLTLRPGAVGEERRASAARRGRWTVMAVVALGVAAAALFTASAHGPSAGAPAEAELILARARYLVRETQDLEAARAVLDSGLVRLPGAAALHAEWGELNLFQGDPVAAARGADRALAIDPRIVAGHRTRGLLAMLRGDWAGADASLERALALDESDAGTLTAMAYLRTIERRFVDAERHVQQALRIDPLSATIHQDAGLIYLLMGRFDEAERYCRDVLRFRPRSKWGTDCLFDVAVLTGRTEEAADWGRRLVELYDEPPPAAAGAPAEIVVAETEAWRLARWREAVEDGAYPFGLALACAANGRAEEGIAALRAAARRPRLGLLAMAVDPRLASLRLHPAFRELERQLRLPGSMSGSSDYRPVSAGRAPG